MERAAVGDPGTGLEAGRCSEPLAAGRTGVERRPEQPRVPGGQHSAPRWRCQPARGQAAPVGELRCEPWRSTAWQAAQQGRSWAGRHASSQREGPPARLRHAWPVRVERAQTASCGWAAAGCFARRGEGCDAGRGAATESAPPGEQTPRPPGWQWGVLERAGRGSRHLRAAAPLQPGRSASRASLAGEIQVAERASPRLCRRAWGCRCLGCRCWPVGGRCNGEPW